MEPWLGIQSTSAGVWGVAAGFATIIVRRRASACSASRRSKETQDFVESVRYPEFDRWDFVTVALQLGLVLLLLRQFQIESAAFRLLSVLAFAGFVVHAFLPLSARLPFFAGLSLLSIPLTLGLVNGAWLVGIGFVLIAVCHLPVSFRVRGSLLLLLGAVLILQRARLLPTPWSEAIWPILGSMFMFRLIVYFYDLRHEKVPTTPAQSVSYFFMLPNACFPLFPVIDFKTYRRSHYSSDAISPIRKGSTGSSAASCI
jgi:hypothetical protein